MRLLFAFTLLGIIISIPFVDAEEVDANACLNRAATEFVTIRDEARSYIFGSRKNTSEPLDGFSVLTGGTATEERKGIFETKERLSSELTEPIVQSFRTFTCKSLSICEVLQLSLQKKDEDVTIRLPGCAEEVKPRYVECLAAPTDATSASSDSPPSAMPHTIRTLVQECNEMIQKNIDAEKNILKLAMAYDAGYRSMLQFAGMMDWMLQDLENRAIRPLRDMVQMLGKLHQIPCFIGQCDMPNTTNIKQ